MDMLLGTGFFDKLFGECCGFLRRDHPADDIAAEDVQDDVEVEIAPFGWPHQFGDVPRPDMIRSGG